MRYQHNIERSPNTLRAYANHLKLYWEYLEYIQKSWTDIKLNNFAEFVGWLRNSNPHVIHLQGQESIRAESTINTILTAVSAFYEFHQQIGNTEIKLTTMSTIKNRRYKSLLHHINKSNPIKTKLIKLKTYNKLPKILKGQDISTIINACSSLRDKFLISLLSESGMRIGQALGLRHDDIKSWDNEIHIQPRNNINGARCKSKTSYIIHVPQKIMQLYADYILQDCENKINDYVFIQIKGKTAGKPLNYIAARDIFLRISKKVGFTVNPHMLRHTHATELLRNGWDYAKIQKRLGHSSIQTTLDIYSHLDAKDLKEAFISYQLKRNDNECINSPG